MKQHTPLFKINSRFSHRIDDFPVRVLLKQAVTSEVPILISLASGISPHLVQVNINLRFFSPSHVDGLGSRFPRNGPQPESPPHYNLSQTFVERC